MNYGMPPPPNTMIPNTVTSMSLSAGASPLLSPGVMMGGPTFSISHDNGNMLVPELNDAPLAFKSKKQLDPSITQQQIDEAWTEHNAGDGLLYYFNTITEESTWSKPKGFKSKKSEKKMWIRNRNPLHGNKFQVL